MMIVQLPRKRKHGRRLVMRRPFFLSWFLASTIIRIDLSCFPAPSSLRAGMVPAMRIFASSLLWLAALPCSALAGNIDGPPINYSTEKPSNRVENLIRQLEAGKVKIDYEKKFGYLRGLLKELDVPESSQVLAFSKTSLQRHRIGPATPAPFISATTFTLAFVRRATSPKSPPSIPNWEPYSIRSARNRSTGRASRGKPTLA